jgi:predicted outer membrane repeat protein
VTGAGAIHFPDADVTIYTSTFDSNNATYGGAIAVASSLAAFSCAFHDSTANVSIPGLAPPAGGAVVVYRSVNATFTGCVFTGNDGTKGHNDITRGPYNTSNLTFACANGTGTADTPVTKGGVVSPRSQGLLQVALLPPLFGLRYELTPREYTNRLGAVGISAAAARLRSRRR